VLLGSLLLGFAHRFIFLFNPLLHLVLSLPNQRLFEPFLEFHVTYFLFLLLFKSFFLFLLHDNEFFVLCFHNLFVFPFEHLV